MVVALALMLSAAFGAGDQYLGSLSMHPWGADVSLLSAPWLLLPFLAGWTQVTPKRGAVVGFTCAATALLAYGLMTLSPVEHAQLTLRTVQGFAQSEARVIVGSIVTGPFFGWLGYRWRVHRAWAGALATAAALMLEPLVHSIRFHDVALAEVAAGLVLAAYVTVRARTAAAR